MSNVYILFEHGGGEGDYYESLVKVFADETTAELCALALNEICEQAALFYEDKEEMAKLLAKYLELLPDDPDTRYPTQYVPGRVTFYVHTHEVF